MRSELAQALGLENVALEEQAEVAARGRSVAERVVRLAEGYVEVAGVPAGLNVQELWAGLRRRMTASSTGVPCQWRLCGDCSYRVSKSGSLYCTCHLRGGLS